VSLHWSFLHSCSCRVTDLGRRFTSAFRAGSLVICHCLLSRFFRRIIPVALQAVCLVRRRAPMRSAGGVYSLRGGDQLVPKKLLGAFVCVSGSEPVAPLLVRRRSSSSRVAWRMMLNAKGACGVVPTCSN
jgi:hypothetical protein